MLFCKQPSLNETIKFTQSIYIIPCRVYLVPLKNENFVVERFNILLAWQILYKQQHKKY